MRQHQSIAHKAQRHKRALQIASTEGAITRNGSDGQYYVTSQADRGRYLVAHPRLQFGPLCSCKDWTDFGQHQTTVIHCKHIIAVTIRELAETHIKAMMQKHDATLIQITNQIMSDLCAGIPEPTATKVLILFHAALRLERRQAFQSDPQERMLLDTLQRNQASLHDANTRLRANPANAVTRGEIAWIEDTIKDVTRQLSVIQGMREVS